MFLMFMQNYSSFVLRIFFQLVSIIFVNHAVVQSYRAVVRSYHAVVRLYRTDISRIVLGERKNCSRRAKELF